MPRVLIIKPSSLGDIVHGLQVAQSLRAQWPGVEIDWVAAKAFAPLVQNCTVVNKVLVFDRQGSVPAFTRLIGEIRGEKYDWALDMQGLARSALMLAAAKATRKAGRADAREGARLLYPLKPALPDAGRHAHALDILLQFLPLLDKKAELVDEALEFYPAENSELPHHLLTRKPIVLFPDSRRPKKEWPGFYKLTVRLFEERPDQHIVWAGSSGPEPDLDWPEARFTNLIGRTPLADLPAIIESAGLVVCNDSGPMHLAAALKRPIVALFGPTDDGRFGPYPLSSPRHKVVRAPGGKMKNLDVDYVFAAVVNALEK
jgi:ADP-heptose:LPS heptosyltransferase